MQVSADALRFLSLLLELFVFIGDANLTRYFSMIKWRSSASRIQYFAIPLSRFGAVGYAWWRAQSATDALRSLPLLVTALGRLGDSGKRRLCSW